MNRFTFVRPKCEAKLMLTEQLVRAPSGGIIFGACSGEGVGPDRRLFRCRMCDKKLSNGVFADIICTVMVYPPITGSPQLEPEKPRSPPRGGVSL